jgi:hypothetical protein
VIPAPYPLPADFRVSVDSLSVAATGLTRPECVLATSNGRLHTADWRGGVAISNLNRAPDQLITGQIRLGRATRPNGIALSASGDYLFADLGATEGGIYALSRAGVVREVVTAANGQPLPPCNFVIEDAQGRIWFTVSTRLVPRERAWRADVTDGFIGVHDAQGTRIVADGLGYTNEIAFSPDGCWVYVNETYTRQVSRFALLPDGALGAKEVVARLGAGNFPDGLTFDAHGGLWLTCIVGNRVLVIRPEHSNPNGDVQTVLDAADAQYVAQFEAKYQAGTLSPPDTASCGTSPLGNISSLAFGGADLKTAFLGCLLDNKIRAFRVPIAGHAPLHWNR